MTSVAFTTGYQFVKLVIEPPANKMPDNDSSSHVSLYDTAFGSCLRAQTSRY